MAWWADERRKDLVYRPDPTLSVEVKTSGQLGFKVYGNRSYGQDAANESLVKKEKSGYYLTVNFYGDTLTLLRFGWIDFGDWKPQRAPTGQMAGLEDRVYRLKLLTIPGEYRRQAPVQVLDGVGEKRAATLLEIGVESIEDLLENESKLPKPLKAIVEQNRSFLDGCVDG